MASLQERSGRYRVIFRFHGKQHSLNLGRVSLDEAEKKSQQIDYLLLRLGQGFVKLPAGTDIVRFVQHDGNARGSPLRRFQAAGGTERPAGTVRRACARG